MDDEELADFDDSTSVAVRLTTAAPPSTCVSLLAAALVVIT